MYAIYFIEWVLIYFDIDYRCVYTHIYMYMYGWGVLSIFWQFFAGNLR